MAYLLFALLVAVHIPFILYMFLSQRTMEKMIKSQCDAWQSFFQFFTDEVEDEAQCAVHGTVLYFDVCDVCAEISRRRRETAQ